MEQPGVNAPGTAKNATFFPEKSSSEESGLGPSSVMIEKPIAGTLSPTLIVMLYSIAARADKKEKE